MPWVKKGYRHGHAIPHLRKVDAKEVKKIVRKELKDDQEMKAYTDESGSTEITTTSQFVNLTDALAQGTDFNDRVGDELKIQKVDLRLSIYPNSTCAGDLVRCIVFQWHPNTVDETPVDGDLFINGGFDANRYRQMQFIDPNPAKKERLTVLFDKLIEVPAYAQVNAGHKNLIILSKKGGFRKLMKFNRALTTGTEQLYLYLVGTQTTGTTSSNYVYQFKMEYTE